MLALARLFLILFVVLTVIYASVSIWSRQVRKKKLIAEWRETGVEMEDLVRHVVVHEAGHHFGFSDDDMHWLEDQAD